MRSRKRWRPARVSASVFCVMPSTKPLRKRKKKMGRPPLHGESVYVRVHGEVQAKVVKVAKDEGVGRPEAVRRLISRSP